MVAFYRVDMRFSASRDASHVLPRAVDVASADPSTRLRPPRPEKESHPTTAEAAQELVASFQAELPNECWQADTTHWALADGTDVEILNVIDDHPRLLVASRAFVTAKAADVVETFHLGGSELGIPASMLTDNGAIFTAESCKGA